jgi:hypothetical protein
VKERRLSPVAIAGLITAAAGFFFNITISSAQTRNGVVTDCDWHNYGGLVVAPAVLVLGVLTLVRARRPGLTANRELTVGIILLALAAVHVLRGLGILEIYLGGDPNPC